MPPSSVNRIPSASNASRITCIVVALEVPISFSKRTTVFGLMRAFAARFFTLQPKMARDARHCVAVIIIVR